MVPCTSRPATIYSVASVMEGTTRGDPSQNNQGLSATYSLLTADSLQIGLHAIFYFGAYIQDDLHALRGRLPQNSITASASVPRWPGSEYRALHD